MTFQVFLMVSCAAVSAVQVSSCTQGHRPYSTLTLHRRLGVGPSRCWGKSKMANPGPQPRLLVPEMANPEPVAAASAPERGVPAEYGQRFQPFLPDELVTMILQFTMYDRHARKMIEEDNELDRFYYHRSRIPRVFEKQMGIFVTGAGHFDGFYGRGRDLLRRKPYFLQEPNASSGKFAGVIYFASLGSDNWVLAAPPRPNDVDFLEAYNSELLRWGLMDSSSDFILCEPPFVEGTFVVGDKVACKYSGKWCGATVADPNEPGRPTKVKTRARVAEENDEDLVFVDWDNGNYGFVEEETVRKGAQRKYLLNEYPATRGWNCYGKYAKLLAQPPTFRHLVNCPCTECTD